MAALLAVPAAVGDPFTPLVVGENGGGHKHEREDAKNDLHKEVVSDRLSEIGCLWSMFQNLLCNSRPPAKPTRGWMKRVSLLGAPSLRRLCFCRKGGIAQTLSVSSFC